MSARPLDHLVLAVAGLDAARERLAELGFTVAPQGNHPFGTVNACVYLADGTFVEPLAVGDAQAAEAAAQTGNSFILGDRRFREAIGEEGLSGIVFGTSDAEADHAAFARGGISGGPMVEFSRPSLDREGRADIASFRLAFAAPEEGADALFFACERRRVPAIDRSALERHDNGATGIVAVAAEAADPGRFVAFLAAVSGAAVDGPQDAAAVSLANARLNVGANPGLAKARLTGVTFAVRDLAAAAALFKARGIVYEERDGRLHVPASSGQGVGFAFEEAS